MNILEHYIKEVHTVKVCEEEWTKEFNYIILEVELTSECYGRIERETHYWSERMWNKIYSQGYYMG